MPLDRRRASSKHHLLTEAKGIALTILLTGANGPDITQLLLPLLDTFQPVKGGDLKNGPQNYEPTEPLIRSLIVKP